MLTDEEIRFGWLYILGREPEGIEIYQAHRDLPNVAALRDILLRSVEFSSNFAGQVKAAGRLRLAVNPVSPVSADDATLKRMFARIQQQWTKLGEVEPYWSVLTDPRFKADVFNANRDSFFESGQSDFAAVTAALARHGLRLPADGICAELGCGVGRVSLRFTDATRHVHGYDISAGNLALAKQHAKEFGIRNATFHLIKTIADYENFEEYDFFYSNIVLQHNPPPVQKLMLEKIVERARPGALLFFQVPVYSSDYRFDPVEYVRSAPVDLEMHVLPQPVVFDVLSAGGCRLLEVMEDYATNDPHWISMCFLARRQ